MPMVARSWSQEVARPKLYIHQFGGMNRTALNVLEQNRRVLESDPCGVHLNLITACESDQDRGSIKIN